MADMKDVDLEKLSDDEFNALFDEADAEIATSSEDEGGNGEEDLGDNGEAGDDIGSKEDNGGNEEEAGSEGEGADNDSAKDEQDKGEEDTNADNELGDDNGEQKDNDGGSDDNSSDDDNKNSEENTQVDDEQKDEKNTGEDDGKDDAKSEPKQEANSEEFNMYKDFYEQVTSDFKANGKTVKGIKDPKKIVQSQQKAYGIEKKYTAFKKDKPVLLTLEKYGMRADNDKLNMALAIASGDKEALKAHMKALDINPDELDMEEISYAGDSKVVPQSEIDVAETMELAKSYGIEDKVSKVFGEEWDDVGFKKIMSNQAGKNIIMEHMTDDRYETVMDKVSEISRSDVSGKFDSMDSYDKYDYAMRELGKEQEAEKQAEPTKNRLDSNKVEEEKQKIADKNKESEYQNKLEQKNKKIDEERRKANSVSSQKKQTTPKKKEKDILKMTDEERDAWMDSW